MSLHLHEIKLFRAIVLPLLARFNPGDIQVKHHYTGDRIVLHSYKHKGYWFHGAKREEGTMAFFSKMLKPGDTVIEIGGHIGYISLYFKQLVGSGRVIVFEPGENNLPYLERNIAGKNIEVVRKAIGNRNERVSFFLDQLSGQNNSLLRNFSGKRSTAANSFDPKTKGVRETSIEMTTLDQYVSEHPVVPSFIKIDIEGFEFEALQGMIETLKKHKPAMMVEVQTNNAPIGELFERLGYVLMQSTGEEVKVPRSDNIFCLHPEKHSDKIRELKARA